MTPTLRALASVLGLAVVLAVSPSTAQATGTPERPWYFDAMRVEEMWQHTKGEGITIAVIDTGVDATLPELEGQVLGGADFTADASGAHVDAEGHGTHMAALIAGTGAGQGIQGIAPEVNILPVRVMTGEKGFASSGPEVWAEGIAYAIEAGADIISLSGGRGDSISAAGPLSEAVESAARAGVLFFAATGNNAEETNQAAPPANLDGVVGIGNVTADGERYASSTYGPQVALAAPGHDVPWHCDGLDGPLCLNEGGGTSSATALASASAALIWSQHPEWTKNQVLRVMLNTAERPDDQRRDDYTGYGIVRPDRVILDGEGDPGDPDSPPIFRDYEAGLRPPATPEPSPSPDAAPGPEAEAEGNVQEAGASGGGGDSALPWIAGGVVVVSALGLGGWVVWRRRE